MKEASVTSQNVITGPWGDPVQTEVKYSVLRLDRRSEDFAVWRACYQAGSEQLTPNTQDNIRSPCTWRLGGEGGGFLFVRREFNIHGEGAAALRRICRSTFSRSGELCPQAAAALLGQSPPSELPPAHPWLPTGQEFICCTDKRAENIRLRPTRFCNCSGNN